MQPCNRRVIGQELELEKHEQCDRTQHETYPCDRLKHQTHDTCAHLRGPGKELHKDIAGKLTPQEVADAFIANLGRQRETSRMACTYLPPFRSWSRSAVGRNSEAYWAELLARRGCEYQTADY